MLITLAITHFNRFWFLIECIDQVKDDPRIGEIVISDDCSTDGSYERLVSHFKGNRKVKLYQNDRNLDCYFNKHKAVLRSTNEWVILFDSDNIIAPRYLDVLYSLPSWESDTLYCPDKAEPHFDYTSFAGKVVTSENVASLMPMPSPPPPTMPPSRGLRQQQMYHNRPRSRWHPPTPKYGTALNTCNYFVHRDSYLEVWDGTVNPHTADSIYQAYNWLRAGKKILIVPDLRYFHRVHENSHYKKNLHKTGDFARRTEEKLRALR